MNKQYLEYRLGAEPLQWFKKNMARSRAGINSDFRPLSLFYTLAYWNTQFSKNAQWSFAAAENISLFPIAALFAVIGGALLLLQRRGAFPPEKNAAGIIFATGACGMGIELVTLYAYQSFSGAIFRDISLLIALFMAGLGAGGWYASKKMASPGRDALRMLCGTDLAFLLALLLAGPFFTLVSHMNTEGATLMLYTAGCLAGVPIGAEFSIAATVYKNSPKGAGTLYAADLAGSCAAALLIPPLLLPVIGITGSVVALALLKGALLAPALVGTRSSARGR